MTRRMKRPSTVQGSVDHVNTINHTNLPTYTVATLPVATGVPVGRMIYVSDGTSNQRIAVCDGAAWRFPSGTVVS